MSKTIFKVIAAIFFCLISTNVLPQYLIKGKIVSKDLFDPVPGTNIYLLDDLSVGTVSDYLGSFELEISKIPQKIIIRSLGFKLQIIELNDSSRSIVDLGLILLEPSSIDLEEINIISSIVTDQNTPVSVTNITSATIERELGDQTYPEIMQRIPGVYATRTGGGSGDAEISLRGFKQENVALLLNGIPISSVENGLVYWNNWIGLSEATEMIQVQKGIGASKVALNSIGGTINIITKSTNAEKGGSFYHSLSSYGNKKSTLNLSTGILKNGWAINFLGSHTSGPGYVDATYVNAWAYFLSASKQFNKNHKISLTILGAPEQHGQRNLLLSQDEIDQFGIKFNKDWGSYNGQLNNVSENFYHKPQANLNHYWNINHKMFLATSAYISYGYGGGKWAESFNYGPSIFSFRNAGQQIDWQAVYEQNANNNSIYTLKDGSQHTGFSNVIQTNFLASHVWTGVLSNLDYQISDDFKFISGVHYRYFKSKLQEKVRDLLGGQFWIDDYAWAVDGVGGRNQIKKVGDITKVDNGAIVNFSNVFAQLEYAHHKINSFIASSLSHTTYQREDRYNYLTTIKSERIEKFGFDVKGGLSYHPDSKNKIYINSAYYSKAPYFKFVFGNYNNIPSINIKNEGISSIEIGYGFKNRIQQFSINMYRTNWQDISFLSKEYILLEDYSQTRALVRGLDALHQGIEAECVTVINNGLSIGIMASIGDWKWKNDVEAELFNDNNVVVDTTEIYANGLFVGDAPQTQLGFFVSGRLLNTFDISLNYTYNDRLYADFDPTLRNDPNDREQSHRLPAYSLIDLHLGYSFDFFSYKAFAGFSCYNLMDTEYIMRGEDGSTHDLSSFQGYWGFGRTFNFNLKLNF